MSDKIKCRLCDDSHGIKQFGMHVTRKHNITYQEYAQKYWEDLPKWSPCKECGEICKDTYCTKDCFKIGQSKTLKGGKMPPRTQEHCRKISEAAKKRLKDKTKHPMYGKHMSNDAKEKLSKTQKERLKDVTKTAMHGKTHSDESKKQMSETRIERGYSKGENNVMYGKTHTPEAIKKIFSMKKMNKLEKKVADYLDSKNIDYTFQFFLTENGICKSYDFKLKNSNTIIEVHGDYWHGWDGLLRHHAGVEQTIENDFQKKLMALRLGYNVKEAWEHELKKDITILDNIII